MPGPDSHRNIWKFRAAAAGPNTISRPPWTGQRVASGAGEDDTHVQQHGWHE